MKVIFRNFIVVLRRFRLALILNVLGLTIAFASYMIIMMQVHYESTFDTIYLKTGRIYRLESSVIPTEKNSTSGEVFTPFLARPLIEMLVSQIAQVESYGILYNASSDLYINYENVTGEWCGMITPMYIVSETIPEIFDMEFTEGSGAALAEPGKVVIPASLAHTMFGQLSAINKQIKIRSSSASYTVGGVYKDFPDNNSFVNDIKIGLGDDYKQDWTDWTFQTYIVLLPEATPEDVSEQFLRLFRQTELSKHLGTNSSFRLTPIEHIYYQQDTTLDIAPKGNRVLTYIFQFIGFLIILIATINFLNFAIALSPARIKSINIQKILGNSTYVLRTMLTCEALIICLLSFILAFLIVIFLYHTGLLSEIIHAKNLSWNNSIFIHTFFIALLTGILSGLYPAIYMTAFQPAVVLKGVPGLGTGKQTLKIMLTAFQFVISSTLIISAIFIWQQNKHIYSMESMMNTKQMATVELDKEIITKYGDVLIERLKSNSQVMDVGFSEWPIGFQDYYRYTYAKTANDDEIMYYYLPVSWNFIHVTELEVIHGRDFIKSDVSSPEERIIFNELGARQFNVKPGDRLSNGSVVVGVVKDFHFMNMRKQIEPVALIAKENNDEILSVLYISTIGDAKKVRDYICTTLTEIDPLYPVQVNFYDQLYTKTYEMENKTAAQIILFTILAVIISLAGVFGLVTFDTQYRQKEIGVRRVMGASTKDILLLFNKKFIKITTLCFLISSPIAWLAVTKWLQSFAYHITLSGWIFLLAFFLIITVTLITVTIQCWDTANMDPIKSIKSE